LPVIRSESNFAATSSPKPDPSNATTHSCIVSRLH